MANNSPQAQQAAQLQAIADNYPAQQQQPSHKKASPEPSIRENNTGLPDNLKSGIEHLSGYSMDDVKVHYNSDQPAKLQAHAYAQGTDIHLASGQEKHLPHEAWHVVQQKQGRVKPTMQMKGKVNVNDDAGLEKEADVMGAKAIQMRSKENIYRDSIRPGVAQLIRVASYNRTLLTSSTEVVQKESYTSNKLDNGNIKVKEENGLISITGSFTDENQEVKQIKATLNFHIDDKDKTRVVIGTIMATPKRTGAGSVLIYHLTKWASDAGKEWIGTDLSALEEGTPDFYKAIGLTPDPNQETQEAIPEIYKILLKEGMKVDSVTVEVEKIFQAGRWNGKVSTMLEKAKEKLESSHWSLDG
ncbi:MAG: DUF4157 domain-containing protein [Moorea sp. SIO3G5]|nr:DUF4157 domain-containing protein [Moorena sp. SIO3G5]